MEVKQYNVRIRMDDVDTQNKLVQLSEKLKITENAVMKRASVIGIEILSKKILENKQDKTSDELLSETAEKVDEGMRLILKKQDEMKFDLSVLQSVIFSLLNVKAIELENGNGEISSEDLLEGIYDEPPKWIDEILKSE